MNSVTVKKWERDGVSYEIKKFSYGSMDPALRIAVEMTGLRSSWHCGYATLDIDIGEEVSWNLDVHGGGCTFYKEHEDGRITYGFDCNHVGDLHNWYVDDIDWLTSECERMAAQIIEIDRNRED